MVLHHLLRDPPCHYRPGLRRLFDHARQGRLWHELPEHPRYPERRCDRHELYPLWERDRLFLREQRPPLEHYFCRVRPV